MDQPKPRENPDISKKINNKLANLKNNELYYIPFC